jgi:hypothetical protein
MEFDRVAIACLAAIIAVPILDIPIQRSVRRVQKHNRPLALLLNIVLSFAALAALVGVAVLIAVA